MNINSISNRPRQQATIIAAVLTMTIGLAGLVEESITGFLCDGGGRSVIVDSGDSCGWSAVRNIGRITDTWGCSEKGKLRNSISSKGVGERRLIRLLGISRRIVSRLVGRCLS